MSLSSGAFLADVVAVYIGSKSQGAFGSGRIIAPGLILTAGHLVDYPTRQAATRTGWKVALLRERTQDGEWQAPARDAVVVWRGIGDLDLALVEVISLPKPLPEARPLFARFDSVGSLQQVVSAGFPRAWLSSNGSMKDYTAPGSLRVATKFGPYSWSVSPADTPDDPEGWKGMSGAGARHIGRADHIYILGAVQEVPPYFSGGLLQVARLSDAFAEPLFVRLLCESLGEKPTLVHVENTGIGEVIRRGSELIYETIFSPSVRSNQRAANILRERVKKDWIDGVLVDSLSEGPYLQLSWELIPKVADRRPNTDRRDQPHESHFDAAQLLNNSSPTVLFVGEAGAGKSTLLLVFVRRILSEYRSEGGHDLIPVVLRLSSWNSNRAASESRIGRFVSRMLGALSLKTEASRPPFEAWLTTEIAAQYTIPRKNILSWIENDNLILFLDGLDEVPLPHRQGCVTHLNTFLKRHLIPVVVTCRTQEFETLSVPVSTDHAFTIKPPSTEQIDEYLTSSQHSSASRMAVSNDPRLREFIQSPLVLSILAKVPWRDQAVATDQTVEASKYSWLFGQYVTAMIKRSGISG
jgi:hypothetical protein